MWFDTKGTADGEDLRVVGPTSLESVDCRRFVAKGATEVAGDVTADAVLLKGTSSVGGDVSVREFVSKGATDVEGALEADDVACKGTTRVVGSLRADDCAAKGASQFGDVAAASFDAKGQFAANEVTADAFDAKGQVAVDAVTAEEVAVHGVVSAHRLEATTVSLGLDGETSTVGRIVGSEVTVERAEDERDGDDWDGWDDWVEDGRGHLEATTIEGETVAIEHATVEEVVGREVSVGPGSHVELVRADELDVHPDATVERTEPLDRDPA